METRARSIAKAATWQSLGLVTTSLLALAFTGSATEAGAFALASAGVASACYILHERAWDVVRWGRRHPAAGAGVARGG